MIHSNIYHVQDADRPLYVLAESWEKAVWAWKLHIAHENDEAPDRVNEPQGVHMICSSDEWVRDIHSDWPGNMAGDLDFTALAKRVVQEFISNAKMVMYQRKMDSGPMAPDEVKNTQSILVEYMVPRIEEILRGEHIPTGT